jgi:hypothetical protein
MSGRVPGPWIRVVRTCRWSNVSSNHGQFRDPAVGPVRVGAADRPRCVGCGGRQADLVDRRWCAAGVDPGGGRGRVSGGRGELSAGRGSAQPEHRKPAGCVVDGGLVGPVDRVWPPGGEPGDPDRPPADRHPALRGRRPPVALQPRRIPLPVQPPPRPQPRVAVLPTPAAGGEHRSRTPSKRSCGPDRNRDQLHSSRYPEHVFYLGSWTCSRSGRPGTT